MGHSHRSEPCSSHALSYPQHQTCTNVRTDSVTSMVGKETSRMGLATAVGRQGLGQTSGSLGMAAEVPA